MKWIFIYFVLALASGCTHTLYYGETDTEFSDGSVGSVQVYWGSTKPLIGAEKVDGSITMNISCSANISFVDSAMGVIYYADLNNDVAGANESINDQFYVCGKVTQETNIGDISSGELIVNMFCTPKENEFSASKRVYPSIRPEGHKIVIKESSEFSFLGTAQAPNPLECSN